MDLAWHAEESNRFGTDEFMRFCELIGREPYLCVNMGTGTMDEAPAVGRVLQRHRRHLLGESRRANGREEPYGVRLVGPRQRDVRVLADRRPER